MRNQPLAVVLGDLDLVSALGMAGTRCVAVAGRSEPVRHSRFVVEAIDPDESTDPGQLVEELVRFARTQPSRPVLFFQTDDDLLLVSRHRDDLSRVFRFTLPDQELVEKLVDKARFRSLAELVKLPVPATEVLLPGEDLPQDVGLRYPLVLKPVVRADLTRMPYLGKATAVRSADELRRVWGEARAAGVEIIAQELIGGPETSVESYHAYVDEGGRVVAEFTGAKVRTRPATFGYSTAVRVTRAPDVVDAGRDVVSLLGLVGVLKADFKRDELGELHLLEVNPRFSLWHHVGATAGVNLPALVYADLAGRPRPPHQRVTAGRTWCQLGGDRRAAQESGTATIAWLLWALRTSARAEGRWTDPMPLWRGVLLASLQRNRRRGARMTTDHKSPAARSDAS